MIILETEKSDRHKIRNWKASKFCDLYGIIASWFCFGQRTPPGSWLPKWSHGIQKDHTEFKKISGSFLFHNEIPALNPPSSAFGFILCTRNN